MVRTGLEPGISGTNRLAALRVSYNFMSRQLFPSSQFIFLPIFFFQSLHHHSLEMTRMMVRKKKARRGKRVKVEYRRKKKRLKRTPKRKRKKLAKKSYRLMQIIRTLLKLSMKLWQRLKSESQNFHRMSIQM